jgi:precorrin-6B methylase 2
MKDELFLRGETVPMTKEAVRARPSQSLRCTAPAT